ncbi:UDP-glycosyltransferase 72B3 [Bienertia sinuspersici]
MKEKPPHIAIIPTLGMGHLIHLAKSLTQKFKYHITIFIPCDGTPPSNSLLSLLQTLPNTISYQFLSPVDVTDLDPNSRVGFGILLTMTRSVTAICDSLRLLHLVREFGLYPYLFYPSNALALCSAFSLKKLDEIHTCEFKDIKEQFIFTPVQLRFTGLTFLTGFTINNMKSTKYWLRWVDNILKPLKFWSIVFSNSNRILSVT